MKVKVSTSPTQNENQLEEVDLTQTTRRGNECLIGRSPDSDLVLDSDDVSRLHGKFFAQAGNYYFCDVGSRNGSTVNGKLAEKEHSYMLKNGDIIRIGDFVLMLEDEMLDTQQEETVVRIINPSIFSNRRQQNPSAAPQELQLNNNELVAPTPVAQEVSPYQEETEKQEIVNTSQEVEENFEPTFIQPDDIATGDRATESTHEVVEDDISGTQHQTENVAESENNQVSDTGEYTIVQVSDVDDNIPSNFVAESENNQEPDTGEYTIVQVSDVEDNIASNVVDETENNQAPDTAEYTIVQVSDVDDNIPSNVVDETENIAEAEDNQEPDIAEYTVVQVSDISEDSDIADSAEHHEESKITEATNSDSENVDFDTPSQQAEEELVSEASISTPELHSEEVIATSQETEFEEEIEEPSIQIAKVLEEKQIVIVGHDSKKYELIQLVSEHEEFLSYCLTRTWQTFSDDLYKQTGLSVTQEIPPANSGGYQAINSLVNSGEIIAVIFLRDLMMAPQPGQASEEALLRICNINNVLLATNVPTAKAILYYLKNLKD